MTRKRLITLLVFLAIILPILVLLFLFSLSTEIALKDYENCTELREDYPDGVEVGHPSYKEKFDRDLDGLGCEPIPTTSSDDSSEEVSSARSTSDGYLNCTELKVDYPDGVKRGHPVYESRLDRDSDGIACE